jgi:orotidine-5'-phosphate decarboxylase
MTIPIVALDVASSEHAFAIVDQLGDACGFYKVGLQLYGADGPRVVEWLRNHGKSVFVDLKAHDIPNTVRGVARSVAGLGASLFTVHGAGGEAMIRAAVEGVREGQGASCKVLVVTVLTSFDAEGYGAAVGRSGVDLSAEVERLSAVAVAAGAQGVVCSGREAAMVRARYGGALDTLVPGVRAPGAASQDQARVVSAREAARAGASYAVLGRAVTMAPSPRAAYLALKRELAEEPLPQAP